VGRSHMRTVRLMCAVLSRLFVFSCVIVGTRMRSLLQTMAVSHVQCPLVQPAKICCFLCGSTKDIRLRCPGLPMSSLRDLMQCEDVGSVAWFVHECMQKGRQQSYWLTTV
jgi:hypothetical protein